MRIFAGNWNQSLVPFDPSMAKSRSGWIVFYAGCPVIWASKLQSQVAMSTTEAEYITMSQSLRDVLPIMFLVNKIKTHGFNVISTIPNIFCKAFEDNSGALELARMPKLRPRTKHINTCYHHFREHVRLGLIKIYPVGSKDQIADVLTKSLATKRSPASSKGNVRNLTGLTSCQHRASPGGSVRYPSRNVHRYLKRPTVIGT
jgi:hypothetical protein